VLSVQLISDDNNGVKVEALNQLGKCCLSGKVGVGKAFWVEEIKFQIQTQNKIKYYHYLERLSIENAPVGQLMFPRSVFLSASKAIEYAKFFPRDLSDVWHTGTTPPIHPALLVAQMTPLIELSSHHLPAIHTRTKVQHFGRVASGQKLTIHGYLSSVFENSCNCYAVVNGMLIPQNNTESLVVMQHTTIFNVRSAL